MENNVLHQVGGTPQLLKCMLQYYKTMFYRVLLLRLCEAWSHKVIWATDWCCNEVLMALFWFPQGKRMNLKIRHTAADRNLGKSRADFEFCLPQGIDYSCLLSGPFWGFFVFFWLTVPSGQALQSFPCLVCNSVAVVWALPEWRL